MGAIKIQHFSSLALLDHKLQISDIKLSSDSAVEVRRRGTMVNTHGIHPVVYTHGIHPVVYTHGIHPVVNTYGKHPPNSPISHIVNTHGIHPWYTPMV
jgi:hypothetical protein